MQFKYLISDSVKNSDKIESIISVLQQPLENKTRLKEYKSILAYNFEDSLNKFISKPYFHAGKYKDVPYQIEELELDMTQIHHAEGKIKKIDKLLKNNINHEVLHVAKEIFQEASYLNNLIKNVTFEEKKEIKNASPKDIISQNIHNKFFHLIFQESNKLKKELTENINKNLNSFIEKEIQKFSGKPQYFNHILMLQKKIKENNPIIAEKEADLIINSFVSKNISKISPIIKDKKVKEVDSNFYLNHLNVNGFMKVKLEDNSYFEVTMSSETSFSKLNNIFTRYPTRFHNSVDSNNQKIENPSQNKLANKI